METTYKEVVEHFAERAPDARRRLQAWLTDPHKREVVPFVRSAVTRVPYAVSPADVERACLETDHALAHVRRERAESVREVVNWHSSFAFEHALHYALESLEHVPTYQEFRSFCGTDAQANAMLGEPSKALLRQLKDQYGEALVTDAIKWRVGNAYLSFLRELYVISVLREAGLDARFHLLADVLFRVDCWIGDLCLVVYVKNPKFRSGKAGRKPDAERILRGAGLRVEPFELETKHEFGTVHLPGRSEILRVAASLT